MRRALLTGCTGLLLITGCGSGSESQTLREQLPEECRGGWTEYPSDGGNPVAARCAQYLADHPELQSSLIPLPARSTSGTAEGGDPGPSAVPSASAGASSTSAEPKPVPTAATARPRTTASPQQVSASPDPTRPAPSRSATPAPSMTSEPLLITDDDNGKTFEIRRSTSDAVLRLGGGFYNWSQPELEGSSIELAQRQFVRDPGYSEWEIRPVSAGTTVIRSSGDPKCREASPPCGAPSQLFEVRIVVR